MFFNWKQAKTDSGAVRLQKALLKFKKAKNSPVVVAKVKKHVSGAKCFKQQN